MAYEVPLLGILIVFYGPVFLTEKVINPITFLIVFFVPMGCSLDVLWKIVFCSPFKWEQFESKHRS